MSFCQWQKNHATFVWNVTFLVYCRWWFYTIEQNIGYGIMRTDRSKQVRLKDAREVFTNSIKVGRSFQQFDTRYAILWLASESSRECTNSLVTVCLCCNTGAGKLQDITRQGNNMITNSANLFEGYRHTVIWISSRLLYLLSISDTCSKFNNLSTAVTQVSHFIVKYIHFRSRSGSLPKYVSDICWNKSWIKKWNVQSNP